MKGISPLIAAVLLIAFTVAIATLIMGWFSAFARTTTSTVTNNTNSAVNCANARISVRDIYIQAGVSGQASVVLENTGYSTIVVSGLQVYNTTGHNFSTGFSSLTMTPGNVQNVIVTSASLTTCPGTFSKAVVTTTCGGVGDVFTNTPKCG